MAFFWPRYTFPNSAKRDARVYTPADVGQLLTVAGAPPTWYLIVAVSLGVGTFLQVGSTGSGAVNSVFGRAGDVAAASGDYAATQITNDSGVSGASVKAALDTINTDPRMSNARTPTAHASTHLADGSDPLGVLSVVFGLSYGVS